MRVQGDHWLEDVEREIVPGGSAMLTRRCIVLHHTSGASALSSINFWRSPSAKGASAHVIIDRDGMIWQCRPFNRTCGHAGVSRWQDPKTGKKYGTANAYGIGIELANAGDDEKLAKRWTKLPLVRAAHPNDKSKTLRNWEAFPEKQVDSLHVLCAALVEMYHLDDITGHDFIAPERKTDPGPAISLPDLREFCGFGRTLPAVHWP